MDKKICNLKSDLKWIEAKWVFVKKTDLEKRQKKGEKSKSKKIITKTENEKIILKKSQPS